MGAKVFLFVSMVLLFGVLFDETFATLPAQCEPEAKNVPQDVKDLCDALAQVKAKLGPAVSDVLDAIVIEVLKNSGLKREDIHHVLLRFG